MHGAAAEAQVDAEPPARVARPAGAPASFQLRVVDRARCPGAAAAFAEQVALRAGFQPLAARGRGDGSPSSRAAPMRLTLVRTDAGLRGTLAVADEPAQSRAASTCAALMADLATAFASRYRAGPPPDAGREGDGPSDERRFALAFVAAGTTPLTVHASVHPDGWERLCVTPCRADLTRARLARTDFQLGVARGGGDPKKVALSPELLQGGPATLRFDEGSRDALRAAGWVTSTVGVIAGLGLVAVGAFSVQVPEDQVALTAAGLGTALLSACIGGALSSVEDAPRAQRHPRPPR